MLHAKRDPLVRLEGSMPVAPTDSTVLDTPKNSFETLVWHYYTHIDILHVCTYEHVGVS